MSKHDLITDCTSGGCGAKIGPGELSAILKSIAKYNDQNLTVGFESSDDAAVYKLNGEESIVSTIDFFSPMVNDPELFGKIAASNALSDIYAMGATPLIALNIVCFPEKFDLEILQKILKGGSAKVLEAKTSLAGGHSIYDKEIKYGLSITGIVKNNRIIRNNTPKEGDRLILTKPLGVGIIMAAGRTGMASPESYNQAVDSMQMLNAYASEIMLKYNVNACTDITGFGLIAHACEMADDKVSVKIDIGNLPYINSALELASEYVLTAAGQRNRNYCGKYADTEKVDFEYQELMFDPQTSGGLLISIDKFDADAALSEIRAINKDAAIIGEIVARKDYKIVFK